MHRDWQPESSRRPSGLRPTLARTVPASAVVVPPHRAQNVWALQRMIGNRAMGRLLRQSAELAGPRTGLPEPLRGGIESLSGLSMDAVRVEYDSEQPARLGASAFASGVDIHLAPGQDSDLPHEAWHVVQQAQGRVSPTGLVHGTPVNQASGLEHEATRMGDAALRAPQSSVPLKALPAHPDSTPVAQMNGVALQALATCIVTVLTQAAGFGRELMNITDPNGIELKEAEVPGRFANQVARLQANAGQVAGIMDPGLAAAPLCLQWSGTKYQPQHNSTLDDVDFATFREDLNSTRHFSQTPGFQPDKAIVNLLRIVKYCRRKGGF